MLTKPMSPADSAARTFLASGAMCTPARTNSESSFLLRNFSAKTMYCKSANWVMALQTNSSPGLTKHIWPMSLTSPTLFTSVANVVKSVGSWPMSRSHALRRVLPYLIRRGREMCLSGHTSVLIPTLAVVFTEKGLNSGGDPIFFLFMFFEQFALLFLFLDQSFPRYPKTFHSYFLFWHVVSPQVFQIFQIAYGVLPEFLKSLVYSMEQGSPLHTFLKFLFSHDYVSYNFDPTIPSILPITEPAKTPTPIIPPSLTSRNKMLLPPCCGPP